MDFFGIGNAMKGMALAYFQAASRTGRTTALIKSLKDGDRIIFARQEEARRVEILCKQAGKNIQCIVREPTSDRHRLLQHGAIKGRTVFDHNWIEKFYQSRISEAEADIDWIENQLSNYGVPHRKLDWQHLNVSNEITGEELNEWTNKP